MTMTSVLLDALKTGKNIPAHEITAITGLRNPSESIRQLRMKGYCIYTNKNGYRLGAPTKRMITAVSKLYGNGMFTTQR